MSLYRNYAYSTVAIAPAPAASGTTLTVATGEGADFPAVPFEMSVCPAGVNPRRTNAETVLVTAMAGDAMTVMTRAYDGTAARAIVVGDQCWNAATAGAMTAWTDGVASVAPAASPTFAGLTLSGLTATRLVFTNGLKALASVALLSDFVLGTADQIVATDTAGGAITLSIPSTFTLPAASPTFAGLTLSTPLAIGSGGTSATTAAGARTALGLAIGSDVQAFDATLGAIAAYNTNGLLTQTAADTFAGRTIMGTSNQVDVANGSGVAGNPTLSTPQNIHTAATPQFARIGLGTAATAAGLTATITTTDGTSFNGTYYILNVTPTVNNAATQQGNLNEVNVTGTFQAGSVRGLVGQLNVSNTHVSTGSSHCVGLLGDARTSGTAAPVQLAALGTIFFHASSGVLTSLYGLKVRDLTVNSGTITNTYGVWTGILTLGTQTNAAYSFYASDTAARNYFGGATGIGVTAPAAMLHLKAGTATAGTAPLRFNTGTSLTAAVAGSVEFTTDDLFFTITTGAARKAFVLDDGARLTSGKIPKATTNGRLIDGPTPLAGTKVYYAADSSGGAVTRKLTFIDGILTAEI